MQLLRHRDTSFESPKEYTSNQTDECLFLITNATEVTVQCRTLVDEFIQKVAVSSRIDASTDMLEAESIEDYGRKTIWKQLFKEEPLPEQSDDAVDDLFGCLDSTIDEDESDSQLLNDIIREIKGK